MLRQYGYPKFHAALREIGLTTINRSADTYGLALILGGAEATLWDLSMAYGGMARALQNFEDYPLNKSYRNSDYQFPKLSQYDTLKESAFVPHGHFTASALWHTVEALTEVKRPDEEGNWRLFENSKTIAWKTGTSFGLRDAWAVGVTPDYLVAVWVGNATGEGRPGLVGVKKAAPIMFSLFNLLPKKGWFEEPGRALEELVVCAQSGHIASENCAAIDTISAPLPGKKTDACPYCQTVFLNDAGQAVNSSCSAVSAMHSQKRFVLPPVQEWYFKQKSASYIGLPRPAPGCGPLRALPFDLIYPKEGAKVFLPRTHNHKGSLVCDATHIHKTATLFWHLDAEYLGKTTRTHQMELSPTKGKHQLFLVDENGNEMSIGFEVL
jgi:penicillin-binding protein 1C